VKGKKEPVQIYEVIWNEVERATSNSQYGIA
jgi:hypothetical protein